MDQRTIGSLNVSLVGLGCNNFARKIDQPASTAVVAAALDSGITLFDTADRYGAGRRACEGSLRRLGTDYIDLYMIHFPDPNTPVEETLGALTELVELGKVREIGCSNFTAEMLRESDAISRDNGYARFVSVENEYSLLRRGADVDVLLVCQKLGIMFLPYFPLASGLLTGRYTRGKPPPEGSRLSLWTPREHFALTEETFDRVERLSQFAEARKRTVLDLAIAWLLANPLIPSVIAGATTSDQVRANAAAAQWTLTAAELEEVAALT